MRKIQVEKADPFDPSRLWGNEKYSLQNMLMRQVNFPAYCHQGDVMVSVWSDRAYETWRAAGEKYRAIVGEQVGGLESGAFLSAMGEQDFLGWCREAIGYDKPITGARIIRYTNAASGYPCYRIDLYARGEGNPEVPTYSGNGGPNVNRPKPFRMFDNFGKGGLHW